MTDTGTTIFDTHSVLSRRGAHESPLGGFGPAATAVAPDAIRLLGGVPADEALPAQRLREAFDSALGEGSSSVAALQYSTATGIEQLRDRLARHEDTVPDRVLITNGALHGLSLLFNAVLDPGDTVVVESPTFPLALRLLGHYGAHVVPVQVTTGGLDLNGLEERLRAGLRPKLLYLIPDFQNPTGSALPAVDRLRVVALAEQYGFLVVSDNPYRELRFAGEAVADLSLDSDAVVRVNTFSKTLGPGLRLGWLAAPRWLLPVLTRLRSNTDQHSALVTQTAVAALLARPGEFDAIVAAARAIYRERATALTGALRETLAGAIEFAEPEGGIFLWARATDPDIDLALVQARARTLGTDFALGRYFDPDGAAGYTHHLRLGFSNNSVPRIRTAVQRLAKAFETP
ncbi:2-aminoadipate transaminase [Nocardia cerradoensis]|uniref:2-aminoadipate transaminase n=1 Tax=Nocardia cerradoensis TaxID=85688 RepID=A0A231GW73_9NOCA|nr:PLP-dependent aminotransferase family protein [Nocardia cerradoensis]OXR40880.1 2-aminoadipate transaminase [Nocardia cerradoensis]